jgi:hypothetical protein
MPSCPNRPSTAFGDVPVCYEDTYASHQDDVAIKGCIAYFDANGNKSGGRLYQSFYGIADLVIQEAPQLP